MLHESSRKFSGLALDQAHEHNNALVKGDGGAIGITEHPSALLRWMTAGPEICQLTKEYEDTNTRAKSSSKHHEDTSSNQKQFLQEMYSCMYEKCLTNIHISIKMIHSILTECCG